MKSSRELKLTQFRKVELEKREMNTLKGGGIEVCYYWCGYYSSINWGVNYAELQSDLGY